MKINPFRIRWRQSGQSAQWLAAAVCLAATSGGAQAAILDSPENPRISIVDFDGQPAPDLMADGWIQQLLVFLDALCAFVGCDEARSADPASLSQAINRLAVTVAQGGVPAPVGSEGQTAMNNAIQAGVIVDQHALMLGADYGTVRRTLDTIIAALASGHSR